MLDLPLGMNAQGQGRTDESKIKIENKQRLLGA